MLHVDKLGLPKNHLVLKILMRYSIISGSGFDLY